MSTPLRCRACRLTPLHKYQAFPVEAALTEDNVHGQSAAHMIYELTGILITIDQHLPQVICLGCVEDLRSAYDFRQRCIDSNEAFHSELLPCGDDGGLVLKMEPCDVELMATEEVFVENLTILPDDHQTHQNQETQTKSKKAFTFCQLAAFYIVAGDDGRHYCAIDEKSDECRYSQKLLDVGNFIRHFRLKHTALAERKGMMPGVPPQELPPQKDEVKKEEPSAGCSKPTSRPKPAVSKFVVKVGNRYRCAIDEQSVCIYSRIRRDMPCFMRHFRTAHPKAAVAHNMHNQALIKPTPKMKAAPKSKPPEEKPKKETPVVPQSPNVASDRSETKYQNLAMQYIKSVGDKWQCAIDGSSNCRYAQGNLDVGNFIRHFRTLHPLAAIEGNLVRCDKDDQNPLAEYYRKSVADERRRIAKKHPVGIVFSDVLEACIKLVAVHHLPVQCFGWAGMQNLLEPLTTPLEIKINDNSIVPHIHNATERMISIMQQDMRGKLCSIHIDSIAYRGQHVLLVNANFNHLRRFVTLTLGTIRVPEALPASDLKVKLLELLGKYQLTTKQISVIVLGNVGNVLGTPDKLQSVFAESLIKPSFQFGAPNKEDILMEAFAAELRRQNLEVAENVIITVMTTLNDIFTDTDTTFIRIDQFLQQLRSPQYENVFVDHKASYPPPWHPQRWLCKFQSIRSIIEQEQFFVKLAEQHSDLALDATDWQYLREFHDVLLPLYEFIESLERANEHMPFSTFYLKCLAVVKTVRSMSGNRFSKPVSDALGKRLLTLRDRNIYQTALFLDPRFQHFKSTVLNLEQHAGAQNYILNIWNRINALKPNSGANQIAEASMKPDDKKEDDMDDFLSEMFGDPVEGSSKSQVVALTSTVTPVLQQLKCLEIEPRQPHDYDVWNHWLQRSMSHAELFSVAMVVMSLPTNSINLERSYAALVLADRGDSLSEQTLDELLLIRLNRSLFEKAVLTMYDWKKVTRPQE